MSFNLVQEEVISNVKNVARQLGILKEERTEYWLIILYLKLFKN